jgi:hypothetical protein
MKDIEKILNADPLPGVVGAPEICGVIWRAMEKMVKEMRQVEITPELLKDPVALTKMMQECERILHEANARIAANSSESKSKN